MTNLWKVHSLSLATTFGVAYILCAIFDALFPPFGLIAARTFTVGDALYGIAWEFWRKIVR